MAKITVIKHDGELAPYELKKIHRSIGKAFIETRGRNELKKSVPNIKTIVARIDRKINIYYTLSNAKSSEIQDIVIKELMKSKFKDVAMVYMKFGITKELNK